MLEKILPALLLILIANTTLMGDDARPESTRLDASGRSDTWRPRQEVRPSGEPEFDASPATGREQQKVTPPPSGNPGPSGASWFDWTESDSHAHSSYEPPRSNARPSYSMPEPGGTVELVVCVVGLGLFAVRRRRTL